MIVQDRWERDQAAAKDRALAGAEGRRPAVPDGENGWRGGCNAGGAWAQEEAVPVAVWDVVRTLSVAGGVSAAAGSRMSAR